MKNLLIAGLLATTSCNLMADDWGFFFGGDMTNSTSEGQIDGNAISDKQYRGSSYAAFEHSIILLPNIKVTYNNLDTKDVSNLESYDGTLYWQLLDNNMKELDLGINAKKLSGDFNHHNISETIGQAYGSAKFHIPATNLSLIADLAKSAMTDDDVTDALVGMTYTFNPDAFAKFKIRGGYKYQEIKLKHASGLDQEFKGYFIGGEVHF